MSFQPGSSNRTAIRFVPEIVFNTVPTTPAFRSLRYTGESVAYAKQSVTSNEIRDDRMTADLIQVGASVAGDLNVEFSFGSFDELIAAALCSVWPAPDGLGDSSMKNGVSLLSFTIQKHFQDLSTPIYQNFSGCRIGGMTMDFQTGQILTGAFSVMGCKALSGTSQVVGATFLAPGDGNEPLNAVSNLVNIEKNGITIPTKIRTMSLELTNNLRAQEAIGTLGYVGIGIGRLEIMGNIELYFENATEYNTFLTHSDFSLGFRLIDPEGNYYDILLPRAKYEEGTILSGQLDQDLMVSGKWRAIYDPTLDCMIQIDRHIAP